MSPENSDDYFLKLQKDAITFHHHISHIKFFVPFSNRLLLLILFAFFFEQGLSANVHP